MPRLEAEESISLLAGDEEVFRLEPDGVCYIQGQLVDDDRGEDVYKVFLQWLASCKCVECGKAIWPPEELIN